MFRKLSLVVALVSLMSVAVSGITAQETELTDQTLFLPFIPNIQFSPVYVAIEKGYFSEEGLNVTVQYGNEPDGVDLIAANEIQFGMIGADQVILARAGERPVVSVYSWFQKYPIAIVTPADSNIATPTDLAGKTVGVPGRFGATYIGLNALLNASGLSESDIQLQEIGFNAPEIVCLGGVQASAVYINNEPLQIAERAAQGDCGSVTGVNVIPVADYVDLASNGLTTNEETIANNPEMVEAMVRAFDRAVQSIIANPAEAYLLSASHVENLPLGDELRAVLETVALEGELDTEGRAVLLENLSTQFERSELLQFDVLLETIKLWQDDEGNSGAANLEAWEATQETLLAIGFLEETIPLEAAFTNDFVPLRD
jgi:NitT/TauT family transport system substrate-binding protein